MNTETAKTEPLRYIDMTPDQRRAAYDELREAVCILQDDFCATPWRNGTRAHNKAWAYKEKCEREAGFLKRVARSRGDEWAMPQKLKERTNG